jgi:ribosomal protein S27AE
MISEYERNAREKYPAAFTAKSLVRYALEFGWLKKHPCEQCGSSNAQTHHQDYDEPLRVRWLCATCHVAEHRQLRAAGVVVRRRSRPEVAQ